LLINRRATVTAQMYAARTRFIPDSIVDRFEIRVGQKPQQMFESDSGAGAKKTRFLIFDRSDNRNRRCRVARLELLTLACLLGHQPHGEPLNGARAPKTAKFKVKLPLARWLDLQIRAGFRKLHGATGGRGTCSQKD
jgi:hypothetical protein